MKKASMFALVWVLASLTGCIKSSSDAVVKPDGSATVTMSVTYNTQMYEKLKAAPLDCSCWRVYQVHQDSVPIVYQELAAFERAFDTKALTQRWADLGLKVSRASVTDRDGWRTLEVEASATDVAEYDKKLLSAMKAAGPDPYITAIPWYLHTRKLLPKLPRFYKTADPGVVKAVIATTDNGAAIGDLSELNAEERDKLERQLTYMRGLRGFNQGEVKVRIKLPGTIVSVDNGTQEGSDVVVVAIEGSKVDPDWISKQAKAKGQVTVMLKVDPATFKIPLADG